LVGLLSSIVQRSPYQVSNWNLPFTVCFLAAAMVMLTLMQLWM